ncbi:hypothetical protein DDB_G0293016 [Dictyostelium discoideum AX4]|uniref:Putative uncharacterized protein DDB_G0293016 n=1 Tax=Dictyostelium discoideum TaxID=44689 RepID=Y1715_DICDI|nr:hypothetical protein DDB_G0293016 [Dictyostelium discoideum AX4]Q54CF6.1 RecName: Full=Putative uncharacterized protein DDB_G0293016 [Dictyostelium discoideum]EAL60860.1 hypothetical protein DDB_G0293016 [Dictyostelium discoideum AX4]|eukprot:XP_629263.1 hypothetical protein DDB_G0293016 [Dictyostelium discoideum AX4]
MSKDFIYICIILFISYITNNPDKKNFEDQLMVAIKKKKYSFLTNLSVKALLGQFTIYNFKIFSVAYFKDPLKPKATIHSFGFFGRWIFS